MAKETKSAKNSSLNRTCNLNHIRFHHNAFQINVASYILTVLKCAYHFDTEFPFTVAVTSSLFTLVEFAGGVCRDKDLAAKFVETERRVRVLFARVTNQLGNRRHIGWGQFEGWAISTNWLLIDMRMMLLMPCGDNFISRFVLPGDLSPPPP